MHAFSDIVLDHFRSPRHTTALPPPYREGWAGKPGSSRFMRLQLKLEDHRIVDASFATYGCAPAIAAGSYLCNALVGQPVVIAQEWSADALREQLGGLPPARAFCANLAVDALQAALSAEETI